MSQQSSPSTSGRHDRLLVIAGSLLVVSTLVAALVIFGKDVGGAPTPEVRRTRIELRSGSLVLGPRRAPHVVTVVEDFASPRGRAFDLATRDFLRLDAARGLVTVVYRPVRRAGSPYSSTAWERWTTVTRRGSGRTALALHSRLYDEQPNSAGPDAGLPVVTLDGRAIALEDVQTAAEQLERTLARS